MAEPMTEREADEWLKSLNTTLTNLQGQETNRQLGEALKPQVAQLAPATDRSLTTAEAILKPAMQAAGAVGTTVKRAFMDPTKEAEMLGARPGVEFDPSGRISPQPGMFGKAADLYGRFANSFTLNQAEQEYFLKANNPNVSEVRWNQLGDPVVTINDPASGKQRDVLVDPVGMDAGDAMWLLANAPQMAGGLFGAIRGQAPSALQGASRFARWFLNQQSVTGTAARAAVGGQGAQAAVDLGMRGIEAAAGNLPAVEAAQVGEQRTVAALVDLAFGSAMGGLAKAGSRAVTPFNRGPIQINAEAAADAWRAEGIDYQFTPGQLTGSPLLLRTEAYGAQKPGSAGVFAQAEQAQRQAALEAQRIMLGTDPAAVPPADLVGQRALQLIGDRLGPLDTVLDRGTQDVLRTAAGEIQQGVVAATGVPEPVATSAVGARLFEGANQRLEAFRAQSRDLYAAVYDSPTIAGQGRNIDATPLAEDALAILDRAASVQQPGGQVEPLTSFIDAGTRTKLEQLVNTAGGRVGLRDLIELRRDIDDDLFRGAALGGIPERRLGEMRDAITARIRGGLDELDQSGTLRTAWEAANQHYAEGIARFKGVDIVPIFKDGQQRGALDVYDIVQRATNDPGRWAAYRDFYGPASQEMQLLRRAYADKLLGRPIGSEVLDMGTFQRRLESAFEKQQDIVEDVFGSQTEQMRNLAQTGAAALKGNVNAAELAEVLAQGPTRQALRDLATAQELREATYRNKLLEQARKGEFRAEPSKLVDNVVFSSSAEPREVAEVVSLLSGDADTLREFQQRVLTRIFDEATVGTGDKAMLRATLLDRYLAPSTSGNMAAERVQAALGARTVERLRRTRDMLLPREQAELAFKGAGRIQAGQVAAELEESVMLPNKMVGLLPGLVRSALQATVYLTPGVGKWLSNATLASPERRAMASTIGVASYAVMNDFVKLLWDGSERAARLGTLQVKQAADAAVRAEAPAISEEEAAAEVEQMLAQPPTP